MKKNNLCQIPLLMAVFLLFCLPSSGEQPYSLVIHGGAGVMQRDKMPEEKKQAYLYHLGKALSLGDSVLRNGGSSANAVIITIEYLEDCPLFNAGKGAVFTWQGTVELDASIMDGTTLKAGAVAGVKKTRHPISAAKAVMEKSVHVLLSGKGADQFARRQGLQMVPNRYFYTHDRYMALRKMKKHEKQQMTTDRHGTVGCVALDKSGNLCAGTSTGGMTGKRYGRIGDTPVIGAGTYADNRTCAVSCTGHGEYFLRLGIARDLSSRMEYLGNSLEKAAADVIGQLTRAGGTGGLIAVDHNGNIAMPFNTTGMFRGYIKSDGQKEIAIFAEQ